MLFSSRFRSFETSLSLSEGAEDKRATRVFGLHSTPSQPPSTGSPKVLLLLHGYPQTHTLWHLVAAELEQGGVLDEWHVLIPDLPGYGKSTKEPSPDGSHYANSKRAIAADLVEWIDTVFDDKVKIVVVGHDRGARIAYRMAKDFRDRVTGVCVQDIVPTRDVFEAMRLENGRHQETFKTYHWIFLATPSPLPEQTIGANPDAYMTFTIDSWTGTRWKGKYDKEAMASWVEQYRDSSVLLGALEDYRAGASIDLDHDEEDVNAGREKVSCPLLSLYSVHLSKRFDVDKTWNALGEAAVNSHQVGDDETGHFIPIEAAQETASLIKLWLSKF